MIPWPLRRLAARPRGRLTSPLHARLYGRPFAPGAGRRLLVLFEPARISYASAYPFLLHARGFAERHGAQIRLLETGAALAHGLPAGLARPTHVIAQSWLLDPPERHDALARLLAGLPEGTVTAYLDTSANADIRLARPFADVDFYLKKSLFADRAAHLRPTEGHTNLTEHYGRLFGLPQDMTDWQVPKRVLPKLRVAPNFLTAPGLAEGFLGRAAAPDGSREIDLHARLGGTRAEGWYGAMRRAAEAAAEAVPGLATITGTGVARGRFMAELRASKMCFSPFGFGELCWRDIEAILAGAVLLKPDMSHLDTAPDLYRDGETYVALRWDFSDLAEKAIALAEDDERRTRIARAAYTTARTYIESDGPAETYAPLFT
ncbi:MAG: glycosyltransferase [Paracoccaceae bacterium]|nr:glycosyltransferase [Paracoccaceae bacterium]